VNHLEVAERFGKADRFTREDLVRLRASMPAITLGAKTDMHSHTRELRMDIELLDVLLDLTGAIEVLNAGSTRLMKTTNRLTWAILAFTIMGVLATGLGAWAALR
jgi:hypothetical protein